MFHNRLLQRVLFSFFFFSSAGAFAQSDSSSLNIKPHFLSENCFLERKDSTPISVIMLHFCSDVLQNPLHPYDLENILHIFEQYKVSSHYIIDRQGQIYYLVKEEKKAIHAGRGIDPLDTLMNDRSIGIELMGIGTWEEMQLFKISNSFYEQIPKELIGFTAAQYDSLNRLIEDLISRHHGLKKDRKHIIGHQEYAPHRKTDPGKLFEWNKIGL